MKRYPALRSALILVLAACLGLAAACGGTTTSPPSSQAPATSSTTVATTPPPSSTLPTETVTATATATTTITATATATVTSPATSASPPSTSVTSPPAISTSTTTSQPPFGLISPVNGAVVGLTHIPLSWGPLPNATSYQVVVSVNVSLSSPIFAANTTGTTATVDQLDPGSYFWQVTAYNGNSVAGQTGTGAFEVQPPVATATTTSTTMPTPSTTLTTTSTVTQTSLSLISPAPNAVVGITNITFSWTPVPGATSYQAVISRNMSLTSPEFAANITDTTTTIAQITPGSYFWQVTAYNGNFLIGKSITAAFTAQAPTVVSTTTTTPPATTQETFTISAGPLGLETLTAYLQPGVSINISFTITGGDGELIAYVTNHVGVVGGSKTDHFSSSGQISFTTSVAGNYVLTLDNTFSVLASKTVLVTIVGGQWN